LQKKKSNVYRIKRNPIFNHFGLIIFFIILFYIGINVYVYISRNRLSLFEVKSGSMSSEGSITGIIIRDEHVVTSAHSGYPNFFIEEGGRASKDCAVMSVDETGSVHTRLAEVSSDKTAGKDSVEHIKNLLTNYNKANSTDFKATYSLKNALKSEAGLMSSSSMLSDIGDVARNYGNSSTFHIYKSKESGIVSYNTDSYSYITIDDVNYELFNEAKDYTEDSTLSKELIESQTPAYKLIPSENWSIIIPISDEEYIALLENEYINITFCPDNLMATAAINVYRKADGCYAALSLQRYMIRYLDKRFIDIKLDLKGMTGLKIPKSAITTKTFFKVPLKYFKNDITKPVNYLSKDVFLENGEKTFDEITVDIYYRDEDYAYISANGKLKAGDRISADKDYYILSDSATLEGVYNANKGYAFFRRIEILSENEEFCIVKADTEYGLSEYDHIISDASKATDNAIIY